MHRIPYMKAAACLLAGLLAAAVRPGPASAQPRAERGVGYFSVGSAFLSLNDLNDRLKGAGYPALPENHLMLGGGGFAVYPSGLLLGAEGYALLSNDRTRGGFRTSFSGGMGFFDIGYMLYERGNVSIYPILGVGGGGFTLRISERDDVLFDDVLTDPGREASLTTALFLLNPSIGIDVLLGRGDTPVTRGIVLGIRLGYLYAPFESEWDLGGNTVSEGPGTTFSGPYVTFVIGGGGRRGPGIGYY